MTPIACVVVSALVLCLLPGKAFGPRGFRSLKELVTFVGYAAFAATPAGLLSWAVSFLPPEATIGLAVLGALMAMALLIPNFAIRSAPVSAPSPIVVPASEPMPPWLADRMAKSGQPAR